MGGDVKRHGARVVAPEPTPREEPRRNMATPQRSPLWPFVAYGALALAMLAMRDRPGDAKGPPETDPANATSGELSEGGREIDRAAERGRGRQATSPRRIPWQGWKDILWRTYEKMNDNRLLAVAAGVVFYALLALFPAVMAFVSLYGLVADASTIDRHLSLASGILPSGAVDILHEQLTRLTSNRTSSLSFGFVFGLLFALWSANSGTKAVIDGLNVAYGETEKRSFIRLNLISLAFTLGAFLLLTLAVGAVVVAPIVLMHLGLGGVADTLVRLLRWPALLAFVIISLARFTLHSREENRDGAYFKRRMRWIDAQGADLPWAVMRNATAGGFWPLNHVRENSRVGIWPRGSAALYGR